MRDQLHDAVEQSLHPRTGLAADPEDIIRIAAFYVDFMSWEGSNPNNHTVEPCERTTSPTYGTTMVPFVSGNGSDGCIAGWFVRYVTTGPVGSGSINNGEAIGVQLIR